MSTIEQQRPLAFSVAYRMLGSAAEAEDVAQETLLRLHQAESGADADPIANPDAYVTTVATRLAIDVLRSARVRRETYVGEWLPEPLVEPSPAEGPQRVEREETISLAFLTLLERLSPDERAVLVLREAFDYGYAEIAEVVGTSEANARQLLSRARKRIDADRPRFDADPQQRSALAQRFIDAATGGDMESLLAVLAPDAVLVGDGGGKARALPRPLIGAEQIARAVLAFGRMAAGWGLSFEPVVVNGQPGVRALDPEGRIVSVLAVHVAGGRIERVHSVVNPDKLAHLGPVSDLALRPRR